MGAFCLPGFTRPRTDPSPATTRSSSTSEGFPHRPVIIARPRGPASAGLSLSEPVTQAVRRDHVEDLPGGAIACLGADLGDLLRQPPGGELREQLRQVLHMEGTAVLRGVPAILGEPDPDLVPGENRGMVR